MFHSRLPLPVIVAVLLALTTATFFPVLKNGFISDDNDLILQRQQVLERPGALAELVSHSFAWQTERVKARSFYRPWVSLTYWAEYQIAGAQPGLFHVSNLVVHLGCVILLFLLLAPLLGRGRAGAVTALFAVSPAALTSVGWIAGRTDLWALLFTLAFLLLFRGSLRRRSPALLAAAGLSFFLALCSKEIAVLAPVLAWFLEVAAPSVPATDKRDHSRPRWYFGLLSAPLIVYLLLRFQALSGVRQIGAHTSLGQMTSLLPFAAERMLRTTLHALLPVRYTFYSSQYLWSLPGQRSVGFFLGWLALLGMLITLLLAFRKRQWWAVGGLWFLLTLVPVYVLGGGFAVVADFYAYFGLPGLWLLVVDGADRMYKRYHPAPLRYVLIYGTGVLVLLFAVVSNRRLPIMRSDLSLLSQMHQREPQAADIMCRLATLYEQKGDSTVAVEWLRKAARADPTAVESQYRLANYLLQQGDLQAAAPHVDALAMYGIHNLESQAAIAHFYYLAGHCPEARATYLKALSLGTPSPGILFNYGLALLCLNENQAAADVYRSVIREMPTWAEAYQNLGICYENLGQLDEAAATYKEAIKINPDIAVAWESLATVNLRRGLRAEAEAAAAAYFRLQPPADRAARLRAQLEMPPH